MPFHSPGDGFGAPFRRSYILITSPSTQAVGGFNDVNYNKQNSCVGAKPERKAEYLIWAKLGVVRQAAINSWEKKANCWFSGRAVDG